MYRPVVICSVCALWIVLGYCNTLILQPNNFIADTGSSYAWIIPPQLQLQPTFQEPSHATPNLDIRNQSPPPPLGGCGHPPFIRRHSQEQLRLPNEFLIAPGDSRQPSPPLFLQLDPVNCDSATATGPNADCTQQGATTQQQSNLPAVQAIAPQQSVPVQPVNWPSNQHGGGIGLLFFVPESASHLPVEQLIRQHLALHRTQLPFDISLNCEDSSFGCFGGEGGGGSGVKPRAAETTFNGEHVENVNYASQPLVKNVNSSNQRGRGWRTIGELLAQQQQQQHQRQLSIVAA